MINEFYTSTEDLYDQCGDIIKDALARKEINVDATSEELENLIEFIGNPEDMSQDIYNEILSALSETIKPYKSMSKQELSTAIYVGRRIRIIHMNGEDSRYDGKSGTVEMADGMGDLWGTWGGLAVIPEEDEFEILGNN